MPAVLTLSTGSLLQVVRRAYERACDEQDDGPLDNLLIGIVFSAISAEGFINELGAELNFLCAQPSRFDEKFKKLGQQLKDLEDARVSTRKKYSAAHHVVHNAAYDTGSEPFQGLTKLFQLRDLIAHHKAEDSSQAEPEYLEYFEDKGIYVSPRPNHHISILSRFKKAETIRWAHNTAVSSMNSVKEGRLLRFEEDFQLLP